MNKINQLYNTNKAADIAALFVNFIIQILERKTSPKT